MSAISPRYIKSLKINIPKSKFVSTVRSQRYYQIPWKASFDYLNKFDSICYRGVFYDSLAASGSGASVQYIADVIARSATPVHIRQRLIDAIAFIQSPSDGALEQITVSYHNNKTMSRVNNDNRLTRVNERLARVNWRFTHVNERVNSHLTFLVNHDAMLITVSKIL